MRTILALLLPDGSLDEQLRRAWISETYLCSAPTEGGSVPVGAVSACGARYLARQLNLLPGRPVIALGSSKAQRRVRRLADAVAGLEERLIDAWAASPPGANNPAARQSWENAAIRAREMMGRPG